MRINLLFILPWVAIGIALAIVAAAAGRGKNVFKMQSVAWLVTLVLVAASIGIGYAKAPVSNIPAPEPDYPAPTVPPTAVPATPVEQYVRDDAGVLSSRTERELNDRNSRLMDRHNVLIGVATCNYGGELGGFAQRQFSDMGLGGYDMLVVLDISGENYWLYTGDDVAWDFSDEDCANYAYNYMEDYFARGMYDDAVLDLTEALEDWYEDYYG